MQRAGEAGGLRLEGLEGLGGDLGSDRYLNRSLRWTGLGGEEKCGHRTGL